jgi:N-acetyltransferase
LADQSRGVSLPFVIVRKADQTVVGSTRFMDIALEHRRLEIGASWLTPAAQRTGANVEAKLLLLSHAFDTIAVQKVVFKTETLNTQSRAAILALGAVEEGTFRRHLIADNGRMRDMVYFSILDAEWPEVRSHLRARLARHTPPTTAA